MIAQKLRAFWRLIRPELPAAAGACVVIGQVIVLGRFPPISLLVLGFGLGFLLSSSAMIFNDFFDLEVDRVNAPQRPLPSGQVTPREAVILGLATGGAALGLALVIHPAAFGLCLAAWILGFLYNWNLKSAGLWGNLIVSVNVATTFLIGGVSVGQVRNPMLWVFALIAGTFDLAEEIAGDAMDMSGDRERSSKSIALVYGKETALRISKWLFVGVILLTIVPVLLGETSLGYWVPIVLMDGLILFFSGKLVKSQSREEGHRWMRRLYISATLGLIAFVVARFAV